jgi:hypothetical protein
MIPNWCVFSDERTGVKFALQSIFGQGHLGPITLLHDLIQDWASHMPGHWI